MTNKPCNHRMQPVGQRTIFYPQFGVVGIHAECLFEAGECYHTSTFCTTIFYLKVVRLSVW